MNSFVLYTEYQKHIKRLTLEQRGQLLTAIFEYASGEDLTEMDAVTEMAFSFIQSDIDKNAEKYQQTVEARREAGKKGGRPRKTTASDEKQKKQMVFEETKEKQKNPVYEDVDVNEDVLKEKDKKEKTKRFTPPTRQEVEEYIRSQGYQVDANRFVDFYTAKGWMVGKNKMKDWRAAVRTWQSKNNNQPAANKFVNFTPSGVDNDDLFYQIMANQGR